MPDAVAKLTGAGLEVAVESGAGLHAFATDDDYRAAGADVVPGVLATSDVVLTVSPLTVEQAQTLRPGAVTVGFLPAAAQPDLVATLRGRDVLAFAMELVPRISRAQSMDALSSQALVGGYRAALVAAEKLPRFFPLFMTAAGTVPPAKVLVLGAGVAGLQAIATARRLGAVVEAYDVRPSSADEVRSMGATFLDLGLEALEGSGGYAREMAEDRAARQQELLTPYVAASDAVITTAAVPGRAAPLLLTTRDGRDDAAGLGRRRPGRGERRQLRAHGRRRRGRAPRRDGVGRAGRAVVDAGARQPALRAATWSTCCC